jgi:hypothetical protein
MGERENLIARIRQIRRVFADADERGRPGKSRPGQDELSALEARMTHLEALVEGLQDSVHRETARLDKRVAELEEQIQPAALGRALSDDARDRGL